MSSDRPAALELLMAHPAQAARLCGLTKLTDELHGLWLRDMITGEEDMTLLAHRGSYKTTCLAFAMAVMVLVYPTQNILFLRKTDEDVVEVIRQVKKLLGHSALQHLSRCIYGAPVTMHRTDMFSVHTNCAGGMRGAMQLQGLGTGGSLTGKHADIVITDDIVNLSDRTSEPERLRIRGVYQELQNIRNPGGRMINTGTPWHPQDAISLMPNVRRFDCYTTGLLSEDKIHKLQRQMTPTLFAANYELRHAATDGALFSTMPETDADPRLLQDGLCHIDAAYGGSDATAMTCAQWHNDRLVLYGRLWQKHIDLVMDEIIASCDHLRCGPILCETNGDKGYVARELRERGAMVRPYAENTAKYVKIATFLRKWWDRISFAEGTDKAYIDQILAYTQHARHDDAPDSAACILRAMEKRI